MSTDMPAFPTTDANRAEDYGTHGMSLRDYFAGQALAGSAAQAGWASFKQMAESSYELADAMLVARAAILTPSKTRGA